MLQLDYSRSVDSPEVSLLLQGHSPCRIERHPSAHGGTGGAGGAGRPPPPPAMAVLAAHPTEALAASAGSDRTLRLWALRQRQMVAMRALPAPAAALAFSAGGELAAALHGGGVLLLEARRLSELPVELMAGLPAGAWRTSRALGFSPDGAVLAVGTDAGSIELFVAGGGWERLGSCQAHRAPVASLDWAEGGAQLQSNSTDHELLFWDARSCTQLAAAATQSVRWATANCHVAWAVKGALGRHARAEQLLTTCRAHGGGTLACADASGTLRLLAFPALSPTAAERRHAPCPRAPKPAAPRTQPAAPRTQAFRPGAPKPAAAHGPSSQPQAVQPRAHPHDAAGTRRSTRAA